MTSPDVPKYLKSSAIPSLGGYTYQLLTGLITIAKTADNNSRVGIEIYDDVVKDENGVLTQQQIKVTLDEENFPYTDLSEKLWNTFDIWFSYAKTHDLTSVNTRYCLVTTGTVSDTHLVHSLKKGLNESELDAFLLKCEALKAKTKSETVKGYLTTCLDPKNKEIFKGILLNCKLFDNINDENGIIEQIKKCLPAPSGVSSEVFADHIVGWFVKKIMNAIEAGKELWVTRKEFVDACANATISLKKSGVVGTNEMTLVPNQEYIDTALTYVFITQLKLIEITKTNEVRRAIEEYFRFSQAKDNAIDNAEVLPEEWENEKRRLIDHWDQTRQFTAREASNDDSPAKIGQRIYSKSVSHTGFPPLNGNQREGYIIAGHYHDLANSEVVWWHPEYDTEKGKKS